MKRYLLIILTALMISVPISDIGVICDNQINIVYAATKKTSTSKKKKSNSTKKKKSSTKTNKSSTSKKKTTKATTKKKTTTKKKSTTKNYTISDSTTCYLPVNGSCYHRSPSCSNMNNPSSTTVGKAKKMEKKKCSKCW